MKIKRIKIKRSIELLLILLGIFISYKVLSNIKNDSFLNQVINNQDYIRMYNSITFPKIKIKTLLNNYVYGEINEEGR